MHKCVHPTFYIVVHFVHTKSAIIYGNLHVPLKNLSERKIDDPRNSPEDLSEVRGGPRIVREESVSHFSRRTSIGRKHRS